MEDWQRELECDQANECKNSLTNTSELQYKCYLCNLAPGNENVERNYWQPVTIGIKNKVLEKKKQDKKFAAACANIAKRQNRNKAKMTMSWKAKNAEDNAAKEIIQATKNSGRSHRDGDYKAANNLVGIDIKLQSTRVQPEVKLEELDKCCDDAIRGGAIMGALVITNKNGVSVIVMKNEDFAKHILTRLI